MSTRLFLFTAWCLIVFSGSTAAAYYGWSPFADGKRGSAGVLTRGPTHK